MLERSALDQITWCHIFNDALFNNPDLIGNVIDYRPHGYMKIFIWLGDGKVAIYDYKERALYVTTPDEKEY